MDLEATWKLSKLHMSDETMVQGLTQVKQLIKYSTWNDECTQFCRSRNNTGQRKQGK